MRYEPTLPDWWVVVDESQIRYDLSILDFWVNSRMWGGGGWYSCSTMYDTRTGGLGLKGGALATDTGRRRAADNETRAKKSSAHVSRL